MKITRRTNIFVKTERKFIVQQQATDEFVICGQCAGQMIRAQESVDLCGVSSRVIYQRIEAGEIHFVETETRDIYVCPDSMQTILRIK